MNDIGLQLVFDSSKLAESIGAAFAKKINGAISKRRPIISERFKALVETLIKESPTYNSLLGQGVNNLQAQMGLISPRHILDRLLVVIKNSLEIDFIPYTISTLSTGGKFSFSILKSDYQDLFVIPNTSYKSNSYTINWLEWLLTQGDRIIVVDHHILYTSLVPSRSHQAVMIPGGTWRVPPEHAGMPGYNFLTKALDIKTIKERFGKILLEEIKKGA
jgi:hypothetical protein